MSALLKRFQVLLSVLSVLLLIAAAAVVYAWWQMRGSLPQLDGERTIPGLAAPVKIERDALGVPTLTGASRDDLARALGFLHAQDRYFQMDLLRRRAAGELAEIFGDAAVEVDKSARQHGFRRTAEQIVASLPAAHRAQLEAYTAGVNAGLAALPNIPWEYLVLRTPPQPWRGEDSVLCVFAMWFDLQGGTGDHERSLAALRQAHGAAAVAFLAPIGDTHDSALDGSTFPAPALPPFKLKAPDAALRTFAPGVEPALLPGSNSFAVGGAHTVTGAAMLANDMHLTLGVPHTWYRAVLKWADAAGPHRVAGVTLPGMPSVIVGSNGHIAWGFTNSYADTLDVVVVETDSIAQSQYRTPHGWSDVEERAETIKVKNGAPVTFTVKWCEWGPIVAGPADGRYLAIRWNAHDVEATNTNLLELETATTAAQATEIAHRAGMPNQNLLVADAAGHIAWTVTGKVPRRMGFDGRLPVSWAYGDRHWDGWLPAADTPVITDPGDGLLWTGNQRVVGGEALAKLGDGGYDDGFRARAIHDDLRALIASGRKATSTDLLAIQLDDRGRYLDRWQKLLLEVLSDGAVAKNPPLREMRDLVRAWEGHASTGSAGYRIIRMFRTKVMERALAPFAARPEGYFEGFSFSKFHTEDAVWALVTEKPARLLNPAHTSWDTLLLAAVDDVWADAAKAGLTLKRYTWGARNTLRMQHPFSRFMPSLLANYLNMPAEPLPGDSKMPRVQGPRFGASERLVVSPGHEDEAIFEMPGGQSGHPLSPYYRAGHAAWVKGEPTPLLPGPVRHTLTLKP
jgi:penicillin amidase